MKIGILTLPLHSNYGGIIQAYALKTVLERLGHETFFIEHINLPRQLPLTIRYFVYLKRYIIKHILKKKIIVRYDKYAQNIYKYNMKGTLPFINKYIQNSILNIRNINFSQIDAVIVGSDQVWRTAYASPIEKFFFNFLGEVHSNIKKIAYAASFGTDNWEYTPQQTERCAKLAKQFDLITVREDSGIKLCKKYLGVNAWLVLDPTLLLEKEDYVRIIIAENTPKFNGNLFAYILDDSSQKREFVKNIATQQELKPFSIIPTNKEIKDGKLFPCVSLWLRAFQDADFVVTDSFHGCIFSIIFNKPFIAIGNKDRGQARFVSLLKLFELQNRFVDITRLSTLPHMNAIDWGKVNTIKNQMKKKSIELLTSRLTY